MSGSKLSNPAEKKDLPDSPLAMTVHDMPLMGDVVQADAQRTRMGRWKMLAMLLICASPVIASYFTYYVVRPEGRRNYGELIQPQKDMPAAVAQSLQGQAVPLQSLKGQWLLVTVSSGACAEPCRSARARAQHRGSCAAERRDASARVARHLRARPSPSLPDPSYLLWCVCECE